MGHWYDNQGQPQYTVIGANGEERDTTLRDARKFNLVPSVTTIIGCADKPGLVQYREKQLLDACIETPWREEYFYDKYKKEVISRSKEHSSNAAKKGTAIHNALEQYYTDETVIINVKSIIYPVISLLEKEFPGIKWTPERSFSHPLGFGGKVDMSAGGIILDFKTKDTDDISKMVMYDEHGMQTAAYAVGLNTNTPDEICYPDDQLKDIKRYDLFISTRVPGLLKLEESTDFIRDWRMFKSLLDFWQLKNKYVPGE